MVKLSDYGEHVYVTRKGAVRAGRGELGIIPDSMGARAFTAWEHEPLQHGSTSLYSMGARAFIVRGLGNPESFESCSHGAGRAMPRGEAKRRFTVDDHAR